MSLPDPRPKGNPSPGEPGFRFTVQHVFYIKPPVDRVILVGTVDAGLIRTGDAATVQCRNSRVQVVVEEIETPQGSIRTANRGQQVGLRVSGIHKDQPAAGDHVVGANG